MKYYCMSKLYLIFLDNDRHNQRSSNNSDDEMVNHDGEYDDEEYDEEEEDDDDDEEEVDDDDDDDDDSNGFKIKSRHNYPSHIEQIPAKEPVFNAQPLKSALKKPSTPNQSQQESSQLLKYVFE